MATSDDDCARVTFTDQQTDDGRVVVDSVYLPEGGFVDFHHRPEGAEPGRPADDEEWADWQVGPSGRFPLGYPLGASAYLEPGTHEDVTNTLLADVQCLEWEDRDISAETRMVAMAHERTTGSRVFQHFCDAEEIGAERPIDPSCICPLDGERPDDVVEDAATVTPR